MTCIKTGADVYFVERNELIHGDLHKVGETYIFNARGCGTPYQAEPGNVFHIRVYNYDECGVDLYAWKESQAGDFNYRGWDLE